MDATKRPLKIPPEFASYADKHNLFEVFKRLLTALIIKRPENPADFIIEFLKDLTEEPHILILGPPGVGKSTIACLLSQKLDGCPVVSDNIFKDSEPTSVNEWGRIVVNHLNEVEEKRKGWILDNIVRTKEQAIILSEAGFIPSHTVLMDAPNQILQARIHGKLYDEETGEIYNKVFRPPPKYMLDYLVALSYPGIQAKLSTISEFCMKVEGLKQTYKWSLKEFNADQPVEDVFKEIYEFVCQPRRTNTPMTPRILIFGPQGSGYDVVAKMLAEKYKFNLIIYQEAVENEKAKNTKLGEVFRLCQELCAIEPDEAMFDLINKELDKIERHSKGWIICGYPINVPQAQFLQAADYEPNRVFFIRISNDKIVQRLSLQRMDPVTGLMYHMINNPAPTEQIKDRLEIPPHFDPEKICYNLTGYRTQEPRLKEFYADVAFDIDGDQTLEHIFESIESRIVNPIPLCEKKSKEG
ncbi:hypothetical protein HELRODRAFT_74350 [Helobdella robusta]|uniref:Uncharacterized protein n=1 Tax=Helobdella robusta TaxID=6412 RepID=T1G1P9_HELRO|nr:hypothetical protein HELRODRAFT_74350 [Helobdella robusta]ESO08987.1 hypothetical protein HELRODRAFT_74350 [Helobdella robusta]